MRATERILLTGFQLLGLDLDVPDWSTGRLWLLRVGLFKLQCPLEQADDWVWIVDHTNQIGVEKCLVIVGARISLLPRGPLRHEDVEILALIPMISSNGELVAEQLNTLVARTGIPRLIIADHGSDIASGIKMFCNDNDLTSYILDIKHKTASELKRILSKLPNWKKFIVQAALSRQQLQQTELAALRPPNQRSKARFMNLGPLLNWANEVLIVLDGRTAVGQVVETELKTSKTRLLEKLGWVREYKTDLIAWNELLNMAMIVEKKIRNNGYTSYIRFDVQRELRSAATTKPAKEFRRTMLDFIDEQAAKIRHNECLPGSSEVLESIFGKFKQLEGDQRRSGLSGSLLMIPTITGVLDEGIIQEALKSVKTTDVRDWIHNNIGMTVQSKRRLLLSNQKQTKGVLSVKKGTNLETLPSPRSG